MEFSKAIFIDVDGTLLNSQHQISKSSFNAIQLLKKKKFLIVLATARPPDGVFFMAKKLGIFHFPIICLNGALIYENEKLVFEKGIQSETVQKLMEVIADDITLNFLEKRNWWVNQIDEFVTKEMQIIKMKAHQINFKDLMQDLKLKQNLIHKILCISEAEKIGRLEKQLKQSDYSNLNIYPSKPTYLEITHTLSSKKKAMDWVIEKYKINPNDTFAIGDGQNDKDLIQSASVGIAMGNAPEEVKSSANFITKSNDKNGFSYAINNLIFK